MNTFKILLWLDDMRNPHINSEGKVPQGYKIVWAKNYYEFVSWMQNNPPPDLISFDHDLGQGETGYDCAKWLVEQCLDNNIPSPRFFVHSANPVGSENIMGLLTNFNNIF